MESHVKTLMNVLYLLEGTSVLIDVVMFLGAFSAPVPLLVIDWHPMHETAKISMSVLQKHITAYSMRPALTSKAVFAVSLWNARKIIANREILAVSACLVMKIRSARACL